MEDTWAGRDLPVLEAAVRFLDEATGRIPGVQELSESTGLSDKQVKQALLALDGSYIRMEGLNSGVIEVYPDARRAVGQWPTPETMADRLVAALEQAAAQEDDPDRKTRLRRAAESLGNLGRDVLPQVLANVITKGAMGL